jgi:hypothetical protein
MINPDLILLQDHAQSPKQSLNLHPSESQPTQNRQRSRRRLISHPHHCRRQDHAPYPGQKISRRLQIRIHARQYQSNSNFENTNDRQRQT